MRPQCLEDVGATTFAGAGALRAVTVAWPMSFFGVLGSAGVGKTTLARFNSTVCGRAFCIALSAVLAGVKELRERLSKHSNRHKACWLNELFCLWTIHRFNKSQQDAVIALASKTARLP